MNSLFRQVFRVQRAAIRPNLTSPASATPQRFAHQSYGNEQSGHQKTDAPNRAVDQEHPGPPPPDTSSSSSKKSTSSSSQDTPTSHKGGQDSSSKSAGGAQPTIVEPSPAPEEQNEEVRQHNKEMSERYEKSVNQLDEDGQVEKEFWKDHTGN